MNAEVFEKKEYSDNVVMIDFVRIKDLVKGQEFLMNGVWRKVVEIKKSRIYYYNKFTTSHKESMGAKSQMFVQVAK